jgi:hypothetical protein
LETFATKVGSGATPRGGQSVYLTSRVSHALIRSQHVHDRRFDREGIAFISEEHSQELRNVEVRPDDILLNITGDGVTFARACIVPNDILPACVNQHVSIVRVDRNVCDPGYLLAYLTHPVTKRYMESFNTGGSRRAITKGHIQSFEVPLPPIPVQRRIAEILLAYDELMENNQQRIRLLEVMCRALYREWFVRFRFPGHEKLPRVASPSGDIPKGWAVKPLSQLCSRMESGGTPKRKNAEYWDGGEISWFKTGELWDGFLFESEEKITELGQRESTARLFEPGTLLMAIYGSPTVGRLTDLSSQAFGCLSTLNQDRFKTFTPATACFKCREPTPKVCLDIQRGSIPWTRCLGCRVNMVLEPVC